MVKYKKVGDNLGTSFKEIYCLCNVMSDSRKWELMPTNQFYAYMNTLLKFSIGEFENKCYTPLDIEIPFSQIDFTYETNENVFILPLTNVVENINDYSYENYKNGKLNIYIGCKTIGSDDCYSEIKSYSYDTANIENPTITLITSPTGQMEFYISLYFIGEFKEKLKQKEINILATGCNVVYLSEKMIKENLLNQSVYSNTVKAYSQANHIDSITEVYKTIYYQSFKKEISKYTYDYDPNNLKGLSGGNENYGGGTAW